MFTPKDLDLITNREDVKLLLADFSENLKEINLYEFLVDSLLECIEGQKKTLEKYDHNSKSFVENSPEWLKWTRDTVSILKPSAAYSEEIWKTLTLWFQKENDTNARFELLSKKSGIKLGAALRSRFAVFECLKIDKPGEYIDPQIQGRFIETLQHERVHVFCRYWKVLKYDIPYATALGLLAAKIRLNLFGYVYDGWEVALSRFKIDRSGLFSSATNKIKGRFLDSVVELLRRYNYQLENDRSYEDGADLAVATSIYFDSCSKARIFLELLASGVNIDLSHDCAHEGIGKTDIFWQDNNGISRGPYEVFDIPTHAFKMSGWWNPQTGSLNTCSRQVLLKRSSYLRSILIQNIARDTSLSSLVALRGTDQDEGQHFHPADQKSGFSLYSIPHSTFSSLPIVGPETIAITNQLHTLQTHDEQYFGFIRYLRNIGIEGFPTKEMLNQLLTDDLQFKRLWLVTSESIKEKNLIFDNIWENLSKRNSNPSKNMNL